MFDAEDLMGQESEEMSTVVDQCPEGEWEGQIGKPVPRQFAGVKDPSKTFTVLDIPYTVTDPVALEGMDRESIFVRQSMFLDLTPEGKLDTGDGKNVKLGRLREAIDLNSEGFKLGDLEGHIATVKVKQKPDNDGVLRAEVQDVTTA